MNNSSYACYRWLLLASFSPHIICWVTSGALLYQGKNANTREAFLRIVSLGLFWNDLTSLLRCVYSSRLMATLQFSLPTYHYLVSSGDRGIVRRNFCSLTRGSDDFSADQTALELKDRKRGTTTGSVFTGKQL